MSYSEQITDRPSSRVIHAPGGASSMGSIFGGGAPTTNDRIAELKAKREASGNAAAPTTMTAVDTNAAAGRRVEVRTEYSGISAHPSTFVHHAPGGKQNFNIFGGSDTSPSPPAAPQPAPVAATVAPAAAGAPVMMAAGQRVAVRTEHTGVSSHASTRVHAAPGGNSQMGSLLGGGADTTGDRIAALKAKRAATAGGAEPLSEATNLA